MHDTFEIYKSYVLFSDSGTVIKLHTSNTVFFS